MDFNVANSVRRENKFLALKTRYTVPQEVTNENAITLVYYLAQQKTVIPHVMLQIG